MLLCIMEVYCPTGICRNFTYEFRCFESLARHNVRCCRHLYSQLFNIDANKANHRYSKLFIFIGSLYIHRFFSGKSVSRGCQTVCLHLDSTGIGRALEHY